MDWTPEWEAEVRDAYRPFGELTDEQLRTMKEKKATAEWLLGVRAALRGQGAPKEVAKAIIEDQLGFPLPDDPVDEELREAFSPIAADGGELTPLELRILRERGVTPEEVREIVANALALAITADRPARLSTLFTYARASIFFPREVD